VGNMLDRQSSTNAIHEQHSELSSGWKVEHAIVIQVTILTSTDTTSFREPLYLANGRQNIRNQTTPSLIQMKMSDEHETNNTVIVVFPRRPLLVYLLGYLRQLDCPVWF
jgi:hypothetical protein